MYGKKEFRRIPYTLSCSANNGLECITARDWTGPEGCWVLYIRFCDLGTACTSRPYISSPLLISRPTLDCVQKPSPIFQIGRVQGSRLRCGRSVISAVVQAILVVVTVTTERRVLELGVRQGCPQAIPASFSWGLWEYCLVHRPSLYFRSHNSHTTQAVSHRIAEAPITDPQLVAWSDARGLASWTMPIFRPARMAPCKDTTSHPGRSRSATSQH